LRNAVPLGMPMNGAQFVTTRAPPIIMAGRPGPKDKHVFALEDCNAKIRREDKSAHSSHELDVVAPDFKLHDSYVRKKTNVRLR